MFKTIQGKYDQFPEKQRQFAFLTLILGKPKISQRFIFRESNSHRHVFTSKGKVLSSIIEQFSLCCPLYSFCFCQLARSHPNVTHPSVYRDHWLFFLAAGGQFGSKPKNEMGKQKPSANVLHKARGQKHDFLLNCCGRAFD